MGRKRRYVRKSDWPEEWRQEFDLWKADDNEAAKKRRWETWEEPLQFQVEATIARPHRDLLVQWRKEKERREARAQGARAQGARLSQGSGFDLGPPSPTAPTRFNFSQEGAPLPAFAPPATHTAEGHPARQQEEESHDWKEGARIGEASNPGPLQSAPGNRPPGNHAPRRSTNNAQVPARRRDARAAPQAPAGESAKGIYPGPNPGDDRSKNRPVSNGVGDNNPTAMTQQNNSRPGRARGTRTRQEERELLTQIEDIMHRLQELQAEVQATRSQGRHPQQVEPRWR